MNAVRRFSNRWGIGLQLAVAAVSWGVYAYGATHSAVLDRTAFARKGYGGKMIRERAGDLSTERELAEAYWSRYPDVAGDAYFGRDGRLGIFGAREHYDRHGRREKRVWGL